MLNKRSPPAEPPGRCRGTAAYYITGKGARRREAPAPGGTAGASLRRRLEARAQFRRMQEAAATGREQHSIQNAF